MESNQDLSVNNGTVQYLENLINASNQIKEKGNGQRRKGLLISNQNDEANLKSLSDSTDGNQLSNFFKSLSVEQQLQSHGSTLATEEAEDSSDDSVEILE